LRKLGLLLLLVTTSALAQGSGGVNAPEQRDKPYLILISIDGFRWDYQDMVETPALDRIADDGVKAERMIPAFPTLTFPNHYTIATGLYPSNHGIIGNYFPNEFRTRWYAMSNRDAVQDGAWYGGRPVWVAAETSGIVTAAYYFVGTEADVDGVPMTYWHEFDESVTGPTRVQKALEWLAMPEEKRPHFITLYFEHVDEMTHAYGPGSDESIAAIQAVDSYLGDLLNGIDELEIRDDVYIVVVSDHGQTAIRNDVESLVIDEVVDLEDVEIVDHGAVAFLYLPRNDEERALIIRNTINAAWRHGRAYLRHELPDAWRVPEDAHFADVVVQADSGYKVFSTRERVTSRLKGSHGWPREAEDMHAFFLASGPRLPAGMKIGPIESVDVYPLMMEILELPITTTIDGDPSKLVPLLK
jgi:predicted AlkP superfamily pyrophosphatase or phosphodiesterase